MRFVSDRQRRAVFSNLNKFSLKDDVRKLVAMGTFPVDPETRAAIDALDDAEEVGGDEAVKEQTMHIVSLLVPEDDNQGRIVDQLKGISGVVEAPDSEIAPAVFSMSPVFAVGPDNAGFEAEMAHVQAFEKQLKSKVNAIKREEKKAELIDDVISTIDSIYRDPTPMDPDARDDKTKAAVYDLLAVRLKGDKIVRVKK